MHIQDGTIEIWAEGNSKNGIYQEEVGQMQFSGDNLRLFKVNHTNHGEMDSST